MTKKTQKRDLQITFIHQFKRATRTAWPDKFRLCWYFNPETLDYVYEHKNEQFVTNGFVISDGLANQLPEEFRKGSKTVPEGFQKGSEMNPEEFSMVSF